MSSKDEKIRIEEKKQRGDGNPIPRGPFPYHTLENPLLESVIKKYTAPPPMSGDCMERTGKAAAMGVGMGIFHHLVVFPWLYVDPVEVTGTKSKVLIRSQWTRFFRGFQRPLFWYTSTAAIFASTECLFESFRGDEEPYKNTALAGGCAGAFMATMTKRIDTMLLTGLCTGLFMGMVQYNGMSIVSDPQLFAMKLAGKRPLRHEESKELLALKEKYPDYADL